MIFLYLSYSRAMTGLCLHPAIMSVLMSTYLVGCYWALLVCSPAAELCNQRMLLLLLLLRPKHHHSLTTRPALGLVIKPPWPEENQGGGGWRGSGCWTKCSLLLDDLTFCQVIICDQSCLCWQPLSDANYHWIHFVAKEIKLYCFISENSEIYFYTSRLHLILFHI